MRYILDRAWKDEKFRGLATSIVSGWIYTGLMVSLSAVGMLPVLATAISNILTGVLSYTLDILFAKRVFGKELVPYGDLGRRLSWLLSSFVDRYFYRYLIVVVIELIIVLSISSKLNSFLDEQGWYSEPETTRKTRHMIVVFVSGVIIFVLFGNILRFDWAYSADNNRVLNIGILSSFMILLTIYARSGPGPMPAPCPSVPVRPPAAERPGVPAPGPWRTDRAV